MVLTGGCQNEGTTASKGPFVHVNMFGVILWDYPQTQ